jgi:hypothetical protein
MSHGAQVEIEAPRAFASAAFHVRDAQRPMGFEQRFLAAQEVTTAAPTGLHANREVHVAVVFDRDRVVWVATGLGPFDRPLLNPSHYDDENRHQGSTAKCQRYHDQPTPTLGSLAERWFVGTAWDGTAGPRRTGRRPPDPGVERPG